MGIVKAKIPKILKELVRPADIVPVPADTLVLAVATQDASEPAPYPPVQRFKGFPMAVLEVLEPSFARFVDVVDDLSDAASIAPWGLAPDGLLEFVQALLAGPASTILKMISEKFKALAGWMLRSSSGSLRPLRLERRSRVSWPGPFGPRWWPRHAR